MQCVYCGIGIDRLPYGTLSAIYRLIDDRELTLFDGTRLIHHERYAAIIQESGLTSDELASRGVYSHIMMCR